MVYICGISAGAAMATIVAVCYPDIFAAVGSHSGLEYRAADSVNSAYSAMASGGPDPDVTAEAAYMEILRAGTQRSSLPAIVFHGTGDEIVNIVNGNQTAEQFVILNEALGRILERTESEGFEGKPYTVISYAREGETMVEYWTVEGLGHAWSGALQMEDSIMILKHQTPRCTCGISSRSILYKKTDELLLPRRRLLQNAVLDTPRISAISSEPLFFGVSK